jgi:hypothetical protein
MINKTANGWICREIDCQRDGHSWKLVLIVKKGFRVDPKEKFFHSGSFCFGYAFS